LAATVSLAVLGVVLNSVRRETVLSGPYNVPYFSTFLVPQEHFTRGGLHQAAIPYERSLRKQGVVDDDGVHYLSSSQVTQSLQRCGVHIRSTLIWQGKQLADELNGAIHEVLDVPRPTYHDPFGGDGKSLTASQDVKVKVLFEQPQYFLIPKHPLFHYR
jgi:hypothetical protein